MDPSRIRNFCIIAHIDHGKSTLADRLIEICGNLRKEELVEQVLDDMELEKERGITIKLKAIRMKYNYNGEEYELNLIDTPGHVDFGYEVSRSLAACEGALLLVDSTQGVQAQTLVNLEKALAENLKIIPVVNKIDLDHSQVEATALELIELGFNENDICYTSGKTGRGVDDVLKKIIEFIPSPKNSVKDDLTRGLIFDSFYDDYRGAVAFVRVVSGSFTVGDQIKFIGTKSTSRIIEVGYLAPKEVKVKTLSEGEVGYIATGLKSIKDVRVGDTATSFKPGLEIDHKVALPGYKTPTPVVFLSFYPDDASRYIDLREAMERLKLSDAAFSFEPENIGSIGKGFRCGFLGLLHADIVRERIEREFDVNIITTSPSVLYKVMLTDGTETEIKSATEYPDITYITEVKEPWSQVEIFTTNEYMSAVMDLCKERRGIYIDTKHMESKRIKIIYEVPLVEIIIDFFDKLKSISSGYASIDYKLIDYRKVDVVKMDIYVAGDLVAPLAQLVLKDSAHTEGKRLVAKLKELIPRQQFKISLQAAISGKFVAREDISPVRKDVTGYLYGGDVTRKKKLLEKQKKGKKRLKRFVNVDIPQDVFWKVLER
jgi:GTP-binding protein LepA